MKTIQMTLGDLRKIIEQIGTGHDAKPIAVCLPKGVIGLDATDVVCQGDRILFYGVKS